MDWSKHSGGRRGYHHGNLREALIEAALRLIGEKGPGGFTVAEAARAAGVSPAAPYRHFRDGQDLLADVGVRGTKAGPIRAPPSSGSAVPISPSRATSLPITPRCSRRACRSPSIPRSP